VSTYSDPVTHATDMLDIWHPESSMGIAAHHTLTELLVYTIALRERAAGWRADLAEAQRTIDGHGRLCLMCRQHTHDRCEHPYAFAPVVGGGAYVPTVCCCGEAV
jgi:hypothetical protein